jgi:hypothetical protein
MRVFAIAMADEQIVCNYHNVTIKCFLRIRRNPMVDPRDPGTIAMTFPIRPRRGRPPTGKAKTAAERMRAYRKRHVVVSTEVLRTVVAQCTQIQQLMDANRLLRQELDVLHAEIARLRDALSADPG